MSRRQIRTREDIVAHLNARQELKGLYMMENIKADGWLFAMLMGFPESVRPKIRPLAKIYDMDRMQMDRLIERWDRDEK